MLGTRKKNREDIRKREGKNYNLIEHQLWLIYGRMFRGACCCCYWSTFRLHLYIYRIYVSRNIEHHLFVKRRNFSLTRSLVYAFFLFEKKAKKIEKLANNWMIVIGLIFVAVPTVSSCADMKRSVYAQFEFSLHIHSPYFYKCHISVCDVMRKRVNFSCGICS